MITRQMEHLSDDIGHYRETIGESDGTGVTG